jgi:hypothetical protein
VLTYVFATIGIIVIVLLGIIAHSLDEVSSSVSALFYQDELRNNKREELSRNTLTELSEIRLLLMHCEEELRKSTPLR